MRIDNIWPCDSWVSINNSAVGNLLKTLQTLWRSEVILSIVYSFNLNNFTYLFVGKSFRMAPPLFHSIWNNIVSNLPHWYIPFVKMSEKVVAPYGKLLVRCIIHLFIYIVIFFILQSLIDNAMWMSNSNDWFFFTFFFFGGGGW